MRPWAIHAGAAFLLALLALSCADSDPPATPPPVPDESPSADAPAKPASEPTLEETRSVCFDRATYEDCRPYLSALARAGRAGDRLSELDRLREAHPQSWSPPYMIALVHLWNHAPEQARPSLEAAQALVLSASDPQAELQLEFALADCHWKMGDLELARAGFERAIETAGTLGNEALERLSMYKLASVHQDASEYLEQRDVLLQLVERTDAGDDPHARHNARYNLAIAYRWLGQHDQARTHLERIRNEVRAASPDDPYWEAMAILELGVIDLDRGHAGSALEQIRMGAAVAARSERARTHNLPLTARSLEGRALYQAGRLDESREVLEEALAASREAEDQEFEIANLIHLASSERRLGMLEQAEGRFREAIRAAEAAGEIEQSWDAFAGLAAILRSRGDLPGAAEAAEEAVRRVESLRGRISSMSERTHFLHARADVYQVLAASLAKAGPDGPAKALSVSDRAHSKTLLEILRSGPAAHGSLPELEPAAMRRLLAPGDLLLQFLMGEDESLLFTVNPDDIEVHPLPGREEIERQIAAYLAVIERPLTSVDARIDPESDFRRTAERGVTLYETLFASIAPQISEARRLIIVPDRTLHRLPFASLPVQAPVEGRPIEFLGAGRAIQYLPAASMLASRHRAGTGRTLVVGVGDSSPALNLPRLEHVEEELAAVAASRPEGGLELLTGPAVTPSALVRSLESGADTLHISAHALLESGVGPRIVLAADDQGSPRFLDAETLAGLDSPAPGLVILSACETAQGELVGGEGILGLVRAFTLAGSSQVVASLWQVDDAATADLMGSFHRELQAGKRPSAALHAARQEMLADGFVHPFLWSGFVLYGAD